MKPKRGKKSLANEVAEFLLNNHSYAEVKEWFATPNPQSELFKRAKDEAYAKVVQARDTKYKKDLHDLDLALKKVVDTVRKWKMEVHGSESIEGTENPSYEEVYSILGVQGKCLTFAFTSCES